ncbi:MAG: GAF domain-containing protein [Alphaproteobacteria bacterium]|nr:GAF domain-containing protein [Alphaproteobacteria bacterium]
MIEPAEPNDEAARLAALRRLDVLDTAPERTFDDLVLVAKALFGVPIALISLIDADRQWFKANIGLPASQTPRSLSFCGHAILRDEALVVPDASEDPRFHDNPLVTDGPNIRFYAGQPLRLPDGFTIGTLCVIDTAIREEPSPEKLAAFAALGRLTMDMFALRAAGKAVR